MKVAKESRGGRRYDGTGRQRDALRRQLRVIEAASDLFLQQGYGATSIEQIAQRAEVSAPTVYGTFGSKAGVLRRVIDVAVGGDAEDIAMVDRPEQISAMTEPDLATRIQRTIDLSWTVNSRSASLLRLVAQSAGTDDAVRELHGDLEGQMREHARVFIANLPKGALRPGLGTTHAEDLLVLYSGPATWSVLITDRGWTEKQYKTWLHEAVTATVFAAFEPPPSTRGRR